VSVERPAHLARKDQLVLKVLRAKLVHRGLPGLLANAAKPDRKARQVRPVRQDLPGRRAIRVRRLRSASLPAQTTRNAQTMRSWLHWCARPARLMVASVPRPARQPPRCARGNDTKKSRWWALLSPPRLHLREQAGLGYGQSATVARKTDETSDSRKLGGF
jgi:hypothetical protein